MTKKKSVIGVDWEAQRVGDPVIGVECPLCHYETVVYSGNYFCTRCSWVMSDKGIPRIIVAYLLQRYRKAEAADNEAEMNRIAHDLYPYADKDGRLPR